MKNDDRWDGTGSGANTKVASINYLSTSSLLEAGNPVSCFLVPTGKPGHEEKAFDKPRGCNAENLDLCVYFVGGLVCLSPYEEFCQ